MTTLLILFLFVGFSYAASFVSVVDYGAKADGVTDCQQAFDNAIAYAKAHNILNVYVPAASKPYLHTKQIILNGVTLYGDGYNSWVHATDPNNTPLVLRGSNCGVKSLRMTTVVQARKTVPWSNSLWCDGASNVIIDTVWAEPAYAQGTISGSGTGVALVAIGGFIINGCSNTVINNVHMNWTYADGIYVSGGSQNVVVKNCLVQNTGDDGISCVSYLGSSNVNITYTNNNVKFVRQGRGMTIIGGKNVLFQENTITDCVGGGIWLSSESNLPSPADQNIIVRRNTVVRAGFQNGQCTSGNTLPGSGIYNGNSAAAYDNWMRNIQFVDNQINNTCIEHFRIDGGNVQDVTVAGNVFYNTQSFSAIVESTNAYVYFIGNTFSTGQLNAVVSLNNQALIALANNTIINFLTNRGGRIQVLLINGATTLQFTGNSYTEAVQNAYRYLDLSAASHLLIANDVSNNNLPNNVPPAVPSFSVPTLSDLAKTVSTSVPSFSSSDFIQGTTGTTFLVAYGGVGGKVDTSFDRKTVTFTFNSGVTSGSFYFAANNTYGVQAKKCSITYVAPTPKPTPAPTKRPASPSGTVVLNGTNNVIVDANGNVWSIIPTNGGEVAINGVGDTTTQHLLKLAYVNGKVWQQNVNFDWWYKILTTDSWLPNGGTKINPLASPSPSSISAGNGGSLTDNNEDVWTIVNPNNVIAVNTVPDATTTNVLQLVYKNMTLWQKNINNLWWYKHAKADPWAPTNGTPVGPL